MCVLDIINAVLDAIVTHLFPDNEDANQASALEMLQALEKRFATLCATNVVKITAIFDAPYDTGATIDEYLPHQNNCIKKLCGTKFAFNMYTEILTCVHHMELLPQLTLQVRSWNAQPDRKHTLPNFCTFFTNAMQTLHYEEATLAQPGIHNPSSGTDVANLAQAHIGRQALLLEHQVYLAAMQQQMAALTTDNLQLHSAQAHHANLPKTITVDAQTFVGSTVDTKFLVEIIQQTINQQSRQANRNRSGGSSRKSSTTRSS